MCDYFHNESEAPDNSSCMSLTIEPVAENKITGEALCGDYPNRVIDHSSPISSNRIEDNSNTQEIQRLTETEFYVNPKQRTELSLAQREMNKTYTPIKEMIDAQKIGRMRKFPRNCSETTCHRYIELSTKCMLCFDCMQIFCDHCLDHRFHELIATPHKSHVFSLTFADTLSSHLVAYDQPG